MRILAIETSCDETAASIVEEGRLVRSNVVASQVDVHSKYGGVVPELASRRHLEVIDLIILEAVEKAGCELAHVDAVAVTVGPGLIGALLVGLTAAKALALALRKPLIPVNHLEGHLCSILLEEDHLSYPHVHLIVSGGHTDLYRVEARGRYTLLGRTRDDAAGEAYDKVAKLFGLGYPGGPIIDRLSRAGRAGPIQFPRPMLQDDTHDFSFSGVKTAVVNFAKAKCPDLIAPFPALSAGGRPRRELSASGIALADVLRAFQEAVVDVLVGKSLEAAKVLGSRHLVISGGVAANSHLRARAEVEAAGLGVAVHLPRIEFCTDNAAMIACAAFEQVLQKGAGLGAFRPRWNGDARANLPVGVDPW